MALCEELAHVMQFAHLYLVSVYTNKFVVWDESAGDKVISLNVKDVLLSEYVETIDSNIAV